MGKRQRGRHREGNEGIYGGKDSRGEIEGGWVRNLKKEIEICR